MGKNRKQHQFQARIEASGLQNQVQNLVEKRYRDEVKLEINDKGSE